LLKIFSRIEEGKVVGRGRDLRGKAEYTIINGSDGTKNGRRGLLVHEKIRTVAHEI
jgi:hypothetical protein